MSEKIKLALLVIAAAASVIAAIMNIPENRYGAVAPSANVNWSATHTASVNTSVIKSTNGVLGAFNCYSSTNTPVFVQFYSTNTASSLTSLTPKLNFRLTAGAQLIVPSDYMAGGFRFASGITMAISNATATFGGASTAASACDFLFN